MKVDMLLGLRDVPGTLLGAIKPISENGGNIVSVIHMRVGGEVSVQIIFEVADQVSLDKIKKALRNRKTRIREMTIEGKKYVSKKTLSFILYGHVVDSDLQDTIDRINKIGMVSDVDIIMSSPDDKSSVMMKMDINRHKVKELNESLEDMCKEKKLKLIKSIDC